MEFLCIKSTSGELYVVAAAEAKLHAATKTQVKIYFGKFSILADLNEVATYLTMKEALSDMHDRMRRLM